MSHWWKFQVTEQYLFPKMLSTCYSGFFESIKIAFRWINLQLVFGLSSRFRTHFFFFGAKAIFTLFKTHCLRKTCQKGPNKPVYFIAGNLLESKFQWNEKQKRRRKTEITWKFVCCCCFCLWSFTNGNSSKVLIDFR